MKKLIAILTIFGLFLSVMPVPAMADTSKVQITRLWGQDRYETASKIADELAVQLGIDFSKGQQFQAVVLASGNNWPDAVTGAPLARQYNAPILLLDDSPNSPYSGKTWAYIQAHVTKSAQVFILGGTGVMPTTFTDYLVGLGLVKNNIQQIGGIDRNETSLLIAKKLKNPSNVVNFVSDSNFYDALSTAASDAHYFTPILLISASGLSVNQKLFCDNFKTTSNWSPFVTIGELGNNIASLYPNANKNIVMGVNRYDTNSKLEYWDSRDTAIFLSTGLDYPDALAGAVLAGQLEGFIVLTDPKVLQSETVAELNDLAYFEHNPQQWPDPSRRFYPTLYVLGGPGAVSDSVVNQTQAILTSDGYPKS